MILNYMVEIEGLLLYFFMTFIFYTLVYVVAQSKQTKLGLTHIKYIKDPNAILGHLLKIMYEIVSNNSLTYYRSLEYVLFNH